MRDHLQDVRHFGPAILQRIMQHPDPRGYTSAKSRFGPFFIRRSETDMKVLRQIFIGREYDLDRFPQGAVVRRTYEGLLQRNKIPLIIDAGANAGFATRFFAAAYPEAHIISVEPDPANAALCRANTAELRRVDVIEAAVGCQPGCVTVERNDGYAWSSRTHRSDAGLPVVTIADLQSSVSGSDLLIVKIDIEGFELDLFSKSTEWVTQTCAVIVEPHDWMLPEAGSSQALQRVMFAETRDLLISGENLVWIKRG